MMESLFSFDTLWWILIILYVPACIGLIIIVLLQKGKGTNFAGAFGVGGGSDAVFGPKSSQSLVVRLTYVAAAMFMIIAALMSIISGRVGKGIAPETVEAEEINAVSASDLSDLGLGKGEAAADAAVAPEVETPASSDETRAETTEAPTAETLEAEGAGPEGDAAGGSS